MVNGISFGPQAGVQAVNQQSKVAGSKSDAISDFGNMLKDSIQALNTTQVKSDQLTNALINGQNVELHQVLIASQEASITMQAAMEIRNKAVEAYQEVMRMNI